MTTLHSFHKKTEVTIPCKQDEVGDVRSKLHSNNGYLNIHIALYLLLPGNRIDELPRQLLVNRPAVVFEVVHHRAERRGLAFRRERGEVTSPKDMPAEVMQ